MPHYHLPAARPLCLRRNAALAVCTMGAMLLVTACGPIPQVDAGTASRTEAADTVRLVPLEPILAAADGLGQAEQAIAPVDARLARLRARAAELRAR